MFHRSGGKNDAFQSMDHRGYGCKVHITLENGKVIPFTGLKTTS